MPDLGGLGPGLAGEKISLTESVVLVQRQLGEGASGASLCVYSLGYVGSFCPGCACEAFFEAAKSRSLLDGSHGWIENKESLLSASAQQNSRDY
jgi:hypothetical protein